ncbi:hypothetical protein FGO68_gene6919 [Halteria grandinella]|uniref:Uncharacterized protein n=1 Tax=Halteria grandinella TaxID=5974 RepID=A0A8J8TAW5_HALGN|nr:hypothetical protein FGO68_gene6919 [Halteria grandinella]
MFLLIIALQLWFFLYWALQFFHEFKLTLMSQYPRLYSLLSTCFHSKHSLSLEIEEYRLKVIAPFIDKIQSTENCNNTRANH